MNDLEPSSSEQPADTAASTPIYAQVQKSTKVKGLWKLLMTH